MLKKELAGLEDRAESRGTLSESIDFRKNMYRNFYGNYDSDSKEDHSTAHI